MVSTVAGYADRIAGLLGDAVPGVAQLRAAAGDLDNAVDALRASPGDLAKQAAMAQALASWRGVQEQLRAKLADALLSTLPLEDLRSQVEAAGWDGSDGIHLHAQIGPLAVQGYCPPLKLADPAGGSPLVIGPLPPDSLSASLDAGPLRGAGALMEHPDGVSGLLSADLGVLQVAALASLRRTPEGGPSFLAVLSAGFTPGIQLSFGFQLSRIGGIVGVERRLDEAALAARLRDGALATVLFPLDAQGSALTALAAAEQLFPPAAGSAVAGPTLRLSWLEVAGQGFCSLDLAIVIELPGPRRIAVVGVARAGIPGPIPLLRLRIDVLGIVDIPQQALKVFASLIDSGALGIFTIYGDAAFLMSWGPQPYTVLSIGGFYPGFHPEPASVPPLRRMGLALDSPLPGLWMRAEGYFAATSNTLQLGGRFEAGIDVGLSASGFLGVDAIVQFTPFHLHADVSAGFSVKALGITFCGVRFDGTIDGPGPVTLSGRMTIETFLKDIHWSQTFVIGGQSSPPAVPLRHAVDVLADEEVRAANLRSLGGRDPDVVLAPISEGALAVVLPRGALSWSQHRVPLEVPIDRVDGAPAGPQSVRASVPGQTGRTDDRFAPGSFISLTAAEALNRPAYDRLPSGVSCAGGPDIDGPGADREAVPVVLRKVRDEEPIRFDGLFAVLAFPDVLLGMLAARDRPAAVAATAVQVQVRDERWTTGDGTLHGSATQAYQASSVGAGVALAEADLTRPIVLAGL